MAFKMKKPSPLKGFFGNVLKGKGALGAALNPMGAIGSKLGLFMKDGSSPLPMCGCGKKKCNCK